MSHNPKLAARFHVMKRKTLEAYALDLAHSLHECYLLIEQNTKGMAIDEKDTARIYLWQLDLICSKKPRKSESRDA
jgi:hypothetical protein